jgi:hypothetical protein
MTHNGFYTQLFPTGFEPFQNSFFSMKPSQSQLITAFEGCLALVAAIQSITHQLLEILGKYVHIF